MKFNIGKLEIEINYNPLKKKVIELLKTNGRLKAVVFVRKNTDMNLSEAKSYVWEIADIVCPYPEYPEYQGRE